MSPMAPGVTAGRASESAEVEPRRRGEERERIGDLRVVVLHHRVGAVERRGDVVADHAVDRGRPVVVVTDLDSGPPGLHVGEVERRAVHHPDAAAWSTRPPHGGKIGVMLAGCSSVGRCGEVVIRSSVPRAGVPSRRRTIGLNAIEVPRIQVIASANAHITGIYSSRANAQGGPGGPGTLPAGPLTTMS